MTELGLGEDGRVLLELARDAADPSEQDRRRVRAALAARLGAAAGLGLGASLGLAGKAAAAGSTLATKVIATALVVGAAVGGGASIVHSLRRAPPPLVARASPSGGHTRWREPSVVAAPEASPPSADQVAPDPVAPDAVASGDVATRKPVPPAARKPMPLGARVPEARVRIPERRARAAARLAAASEPLAAAWETTRPAEEPEHGAPTVTVPPDHGNQDAQPPAPAMPTLAQESRLVHGAAAALRAGQAARALALCDAHAIFYPQGVLAEECAAQRVLALADLGRVVEARAAAEPFLRAHPTSPLAARLRKRLRALDAP